MYVVTDMLISVCNRSTSLLDNLFGVLSQALLKRFDLCSEKVDISYEFLTMPNQ